MMQSLRNIFFFLLGSRNEALRAYDCKKAQSDTFPLIIRSSLEVVINLNVSDELNMHGTALISL